MLTSDQIRKTAELLEAKASPEQIAQELGYSRSSFIDHLKESGWLIEIRRELVPINRVPLTEEQPTAAAA